MKARMYSKISFGRMSMLTASLAPSSMSLDGLSRRLFLVLGMAPSSITFRVLSHKVSHPERTVFGGIKQNSIHQRIENATMNKVYE